MEGSKIDSTDTESLQYNKEDDLISECDSVQEESSKKKRSTSFDKCVKIPAKSIVTDEYSREETKREKYHLLSLDAYSRHKKLINDYLQYYGGSKDVFQRDSSKDKTDEDILRENHQFLWEDDDEEEKNIKNNWGKRLAKKYYDKLFKEYCVADLSLYKKKKIAMRWRIEKEVWSGKGQFICGEKNCQIEKGLRSWEVNFAYNEQDEKKNALVKLRLCPDCSYKLNYHYKKKEVINKPKKRKHILDDEYKKNSKIKIGEAKFQETMPNKQKSDTNIWKEEKIIDKDKSKEEEFDEYFEDIFL